MTEPTTTTPPTVTDGAPAAPPVADNSSTDKTNNDSRADKPELSSNEAKDTGNSENEPEEWQVQRDHHKQLADTAFKCQGFKTAIDEYSKAISLDPDFVVLYSNRSAAYLRNSEKSKALKDAEKCVALDPKFAKGYSRLGAALHSLRRYDKAKEAYHQVLTLDANNAVAKKGIQDCEAELERQRKEHEQQKEVFEEQFKAQKGEATDAATTSSMPAEDGDNKDKSAEKTGEDEDDDDDLLNDFFDDVEEAVAEKKNKKAAANEEVKATNAIKNQKLDLGTTASQIERLLKPNYEWRNLNPFYVLQLTHDANEEEISRRYKALSLLLHPDKNHGNEQAQLAYDQVQKAKTILSDSTRAKHAQMLAEEGAKIGQQLWDKSDQKTDSLEAFQERETLRIFAQVEQKRREVEERERKFEQRERQQEDEAEEKERQSRKFDKQWRDEERVGKRVGNWRDFANGGKKKKKKFDK